MKSTSDELRQRGYINDSDANAFHLLSYAELTEQLNAEAAWERSLAVRTLSSGESVDETVLIAMLLERLAIEKALYTKIEICNVLEAGHVHTAQMMLDYLGLIGNNQHKTIPATVSKKKSFPLPRDIIARSLGRMNPAICGTLLNYIHLANLPQLAELIDAIGYFMYNNPALADSTAFDSIQYIYNMYEKNELIIWKTTICCSAFHTDESIALLNHIKATTNHPTIRMEAERSLNRPLMPSYWHSCANGKAH